MTTYNYTISTDVTSGTVSVDRMTNEIQGSDIVTALAGVTVVDDSLDIEFKADLSAGDQTILDGLVQAHSGLPMPDADTEVRAIDGRLKVRADSLPPGTSTTFSCEGDAPGEIGGGNNLFWDFSNTDNDITAPAGFKRKRMIITFNDPIYIKEGTIYYHDKVKGSYVDVYVGCPDGAYYLDRTGAPQLASGIVPLSYYIRHHYIAGTVQMGDELNTEVAQENAVPPGYLLVCEVTVPDTDSTSFGWGSIEMYRTRSCLLPNESI